MIKSFGAVLIIISFALAGSYRASELRARARLLGALASALENLCSEVSCRLTPLPEAAMLLSRTGPEETRSFFSDLAKGLGELDRRGFGEIWKDLVLTLPLLMPEETAALGALGGSLGRYGAAEQAGAIERCKEYFVGRTAAAEQSAASGGRMYAGLGITAGLLVAVTLL